MATFADSWTNYNPNSKLKDEKIDLFIDDNINNCLSVRELDTKVLLFGENKEYDERYSSSQRPIGGGYLLMTNSSTEQKCQRINNIL